jgi:polyhydroxybutyrate depolymerase
MSGRRSGVRRLATAVALAGTACATPPSEPLAGGAEASPEASASTAPAMDRDETYVAAPGTLHEHQTFQSGGRRRTYHFYEAGGTPREGRPLVLVLHGGFATIDAFIGKPRGAAPLAGVWLELAEEHGLHVAIPQAIDPGKGPHWNDCRGDCRHCGEQDDASFLVELVEHLARQHAVDRDRIYVSGESNGGFMTLRLAQEHPRLFAAFGVVAAAMPAKNRCGSPTSPVSLAFVVGAADKAIPHAGGRSSLAASGSVLSAERSVAAWTTVARCKHPPTVQRIPDRDPRDGSTVMRQLHTCEGAREILLLTVNGGGHVVPSIAQPVSRMWESVVGRQNHDIETAAELWRFFSAHPRNSG